ncbi:Transmembrane_domain-containing protein [Hexamita inflata]|uniref:Transmembrane domain-containing protein n=1 Tax=Hexamita inflata TaxID=28002 RepID=A0AA86N9I6_9EUKA|nr:Transmembrane domain-containing protein [Hexamita inflata]
MQFYSNILLGGITVASVSIIACVSYFKKYSPNKYWPTISEAGAFEQGYIFYSTGMLIGSILLFLGLSLYFKVHLKAKSSRFVITCYLFIMCFAMAFQGIVKIELDKMQDIHRQAAGIFFSMAFFVGIYANIKFQETNCNKKRKYIHRAMVLIAVILIAVNIYLFKSFNVDLSIRTDVNQTSLMSQFAYIQYTFVVSLFISILTIMQ